MAQWFKSDLPADVLRAALSSTDDIGVFLRAHHLVEQATERAAQSLYEKYEVFGHDTLSKHLNAFVARGADGPVIRAARVLSKHRRDFAHTRTFIVGDKHVRELSNELKLSMSDRWVIPIEGLNKEFVDLSNAQKYLVICVSIAGTIEQMGRKFEELKKGSEKMIVKVGSQD